MRDLRPQSRLGHHAETPTAVFKQSVFWNPFMWVFWNPKSKSKPILTRSWSAASDQKIRWWRTKKKKAYNEEKKFSWWDRGKEMVWRMGCVNGKGVWREESGLGREEEEEEEKKNERKEMIWRMRQDTINGGHHVNIFTEVLLSYELWKLKTAKMCFQFP